MTTSLKSLVRNLGAVIALGSSVALAANWQTTGYMTTVNVYTDNGVTYFGFPQPLAGNCANSRLQLDETGDYWGHSENAKRLYALILAAQLAGKAMNFGYDASDPNSPNCRVASVWVQW